MIPSCTGVPTIDTLPVAQDDCQVQVDSVSQTAVDVQTGFKHMLTSFSADVNVDRLQAVKSGFDDLQRDYDVQAMRLCKDRRGGMSEAEYSARRTCLDRTLTTMRTMKLLLESGKDSKEIAWVIDAKLESLSDSLSCDIPATPAGTTVAGTDMHFMTDAGKPKVGGEVTLEAALICQRKVGAGKYEDVPDCNRAVMKEDDRFKIAFQTAGPARVYLMIYNDTGQFQMLFPDPGADNEVAAGQQNILPADSWFELDDTSGVMETIQVVASNYKIAEFEELRGTDIAGASKTPVGRKAMPKVAMKTRAIVEPIMFRGVKTGKKPAALSKPASGGSSAALKAIPVVTSRPDVAAVEMWIDHQ
jgi:hypothetical protein